MSKTKPFKPSFHFFLFTAPVFAVAAGTFLLVLSVKLKNDKPLPVFSEIPAFELTDQNSQPFLSRDDLKGKVWIANFIFTRCSGPCPLMTQTMKKLTQKFKETAPLRYVSFSVDPDHDTPEVLRKYRDAYGVEMKSWVFLTGARSAIYDLAIKRFYMGISEETSQGDGLRPESFILHSTKFVLVDSASRLRGYYDSEDAASMERLMRDALKLMKEAPAS